MNFRVAPRFKSLVEMDGVEMNEESRRAFNFLWDRCTTSEEFTFWWEFYRGLLHTLTRRWCYFHACVQPWGHAGRCYCSCGWDMGKKLDRTRHLNGYLSCGPIGGFGLTLSKIDVPD